MAAFVRANNIYVTDLTTGAETAVTADGNDNVINGTSDWVYEEELDLRDAFRWSADGSRIAFWRLDQSAIRPFYLQDFDSLYAPLVPVRYPKSGTANSEVKIGVVELGTGRTSWVDLGPDRDIYVAAMDFAGSPDEVWLTRLNRPQNRLDLVLADANFDRAGDARRRVRSHVHPLRRHLFAGRCPSRPDIAARERNPGAHHRGRCEAGGPGDGAGRESAGVHHDSDGRWCGAQRLGHQAEGVRSVAALSAAHERVRRARVPDGDRLLGRPQLPVAPAARAGRLPGRERGQSRHGRP